MYFHAASRRSTTTSGGRQRLTDDVTSNNFAATGSALQMAAVISCCQQRSERHEISDNLPDHVLFEWKPVEFPEPPSGRSSFRMHLVCSSISFYGQRASWLILCWSFDLPSNQRDMRRIYCCSGNRPLQCVNVQSTLCMCRSVSKPPDSAPDDTFCRFIRNGPSPVFTCACFLKNFIYREVCAEGW